MAGRPDEDWNLDLYVARLRQERPEVERTTGPNILNYLHSDNARAKHGDIDVHQVHEGFIVTVWTIGGYQRNFDIVLRDIENLVLTNDDLSIVDIVDELVALAKIPRNTEHEV